MELVPISMELYPFLHLQIHKIMYPHILYLSHYVYPRISLPNLDPEKFLGFHMLISGGIPCSHDVYSRVSVFLSHYVSISDGIPWSCKVYPRICLVILDSKLFLAFPWSCNVSKDPFSNFRFIWQNQHLKTKVSLLHDQHYI